VLAHIRPTDRSAWAIPPDMYLRTHVESGACPVWAGLYLCPHKCGRPGPTRGDAAQREAARPRHAAPAARPAQRDAVRPNAGAARRGAGAASVTIEQ